MARISGRGSAAFATLLILLLAPLAAVGATADETMLQVVLEIDEADGDALWHAEEVALSIAISIYNPSSSTISFDYNPSCPFQISFIDSVGEIHSNDREHRTCFQQERGIDISPGQTRSIDSLDWDWTNTSGVTALSGEVTIEVRDDSNLIVATRTIDFQRTPVSIPGLSLTMNTPPLPAGQESLLTGDSFTSYLALKNDGSEDITITADSGCRVAIKPVGVGQSLPMQTTNLGCMSNEVIPAATEIGLGWLIWDLTSDGTAVSSGEWRLDVSLSGIQDMTASANLAIQTGAQTLPEGVLMVSSVSGDGGLDGTFTDADNVILYTNLTNVGQDMAELRFNDTCMVKWHVLSPDGTLLFDSRGAESCEEDFSEYKVEPSDGITIGQTIVSMSDYDGCELDDGTYLIVTNAPEYGTTRTVELVYDGGDTGLACRASLQDSSLATLTTSLLETVDRGTFDERLTFDLSLDTAIDMDVYWPTECRIEMTLTHMGETHSVQDGVCAEEVGVSQTIVAGESLSFSSFEIEFRDLKAGTWTIDLATTGTPAFSTRMTHVWNPPQEDASDEDEEKEEPVEELGTDEQDELIVGQGWLAEGAWKHVTTDVGGCWLLVDINGVEHAYLSTTLTSWEPKPDYRGAYWFEPAITNTDACSAWESSVVVTEVMGEIHEQSVVVEDEDVTTETTTVRLPVSAPAVAGLVASTSLLAILIGLVTKVEWIRLPATKYGLALLGLVRTGQEKGGDYQRGRIVAYIELHKGIHFRALMDALGMSNGQLTHHLSVLESEERIWRRKDGRKVRYYPSSVDSKTDDDELPVPVLTPDPNSIQGRILQMLDIHENEILNLSQRELSDKLETSQQLVSYHLKSMEQWGLVEKERVALRFRYRLTDRALVLLNSSEFPRLGDDL